MEEKLIKELSAQNWKGLMILDDVKDGALKNLAKNSGYNCCDLTRYGHCQLPTNKFMSLLQESGGIPTNPNNRLIDCSPTSLKDRNSIKNRVSTVAVDCLTIQ